MGARVRLQRTRRRPTDYRSDRHLAVAQSGAMSSAKRTVHEVGALVSNVIDATRGLQPWELPQSVLGRLRRAAPPRYSEYAMFIERDVGRTARYSTNVLIPSLHRAGPP